MKDRPSYTEAVMQFFRDHPARWIDATRLEAVGGRQAWRTRVADARKRFKAAGDGDILNRQRRQRVDGRDWTLSEYCFQPREQPTPSSDRGHDVNKPTEGRLI